MPHEELPLLERKLLALATKLGLECKFSADNPTYAYEKRKVIYVGDTVEKRCSNLAHDIAHFLIAPKCRRLMVDFGLGTSPDSMEYTAPEVLDRGAAYQEELQASFLGLHIELWAGSDGEYTKAAHSWDVEELKAGSHYGKRLETKHLVNRRGSRYVFTQKLAMKRIYG